MYVLSVLNKKGGVGKTTVASHLAQALGLIGQKVLVIDNDEQHNLTRTLGISVAEVNLADIYSSNIDEGVVAKALKQTFLENVHCITGSARLASINIHTETLKKLVNSEIIKGLQYEVIIIDNCPSFDAKTKSAIAASDFFIVPVQLKQLAVDGLTELMALMTKEYGVDKKNIRILRNFWKPTRHRDAMSIAVQSMFQDNVLKTIIPEDEAIDEIVTDNKSIFLSRSKAKCVGKFEDVICELFGFTTDEVWNKLMEARKKYTSDIARENLKKANIGLNIRQNEEEVAA
ncbi:MAG: ParA family protein [Chitinivibrionales bacterium]|nr:ParA family protein [Chitinivibrionales bacterium]